ncbi:hypothetical protein PR048_009758 [Dryococelus australis]|uniref:Uncharacterized protein n=1 Tax=Dryococelus australis TaxID=614101 RepID=A0ABQ9I0U9_9NEOP|nr:hypothetical protein PR048_009758 [Dryococelus australis]
MLCGIIESHRSNSRRVVMVRAVIAGQLTASAALIVLVAAKCKIGTNRTKTVRTREEHGACSNLLKGIQIEDAQQYRNFIRMTAEDLEVLLLKIGS